MTARVVQIAAPALADLQRHAAWLTQTGAGPKALRELNAIEQAVVDLAHRPATWPVDRDHPGTRRRTVGRYAIMYEVAPDTGSNDSAGDVRVLRIFGPGQDRADLIPR